MYKNKAIHNIKVIDEEYQGDPLKKEDNLITHS